MTNKKKRVKTGNNIEDRFGITIKTNILKKKKNKKNK